MTTELWRRHPSERPAGTPTLTEQEAAELDAQISDQWRREETGWLRREYQFKTFAAAFAFATRLALLAERQNHHPELEVGWGYARVALTTHSVGGLSENDYIMAARIDRLS